MIPIATLGIHHVGVAVHDLDATIERYTTTVGAVLEMRAELPAHGVEAASLHIGAAGLSDEIELISPLGDDSPIAGFLERRGEGLHHIAFSVPDVAQALAQLQSEGVTLIDTEPRIGFHGVPVAFVHPKAFFGVLVELVSANSKES